MKKLFYLIVMITTAYWISGCDDAQQFDNATLNSCGSGQYQTESGECKNHSFKVANYPGYSSYTPGGVGSFVVEGIEPGELAVSINGTAADVHILQDRIFVPIPLSASGTVDIMFSNPEGEAQKISQKISQPQLLNANEVITEQANKSHILLDAMEDRVNSLDTARPDNLLPASESVDSSISNSEQLLDGDEAETAASAANTVAPILLGGSESPDIHIAAKSLRKQTNATCDDITQNLQTLNEVLSDEAGVLQAIVTPLTKQTNAETAAKFVMGVGWAYWTDEMISFFEGMDKFATRCATTSYEVQVGGEAVSNSAVTSVNSEQPVSFELSRTRIFESEAANVAKSELKPLIDAVMSISSNFFEGIDVHVDALDQEEYTSQVSAEDLKVTIPSSSNVSTESYIEEGVLYIMFMPTSGTLPNTAVPVTVTDSATSETVNVDIMFNK